MNRMSDYGVLVNIGIRTLQMKKTGDIPLVLRYCVVHDNKGFEDFGNKSNTATNHGKSIIVNSRERS